MKPTRTLTHHLRTLVGSVLAMLNAGTAVANINKVDIQKGERPTLARTLVTPENAQQLGLDYQKILEAVKGQNSKVNYPAVEVTTNAEGDGSADIHTLDLFDDLVVRVPVETILAMPNREGRGVP